MSWVWVFSSSLITHDERVAKAMSEKRVLMKALWPMACGNNLMFRMACRRPLRKLV